VDVPTGTPNAPTLNAAFDSTLGLNAGRSTIDGPAASRRTRV